jgi:HEAT repeat protein
MANEKVIRFDSRKRLIAKAAEYLEDIEAFLSDLDRAVPLLIQVLKTDADDDLKREIIMLLGGFAKHQVAFPLFEIMCDPAQSDEIRHTAAIQLSVTASFLKSSDNLVDCLVSQLTHPDPQHRANAAFALGWEGNHRAVIALIEKLYDPDPMVQQAAVNALSNLHDDRILDLMLDRLEHGHLDQKRAILYNLWRFYSRQEQVLSVYRAYLGNKDPDLRFDALVMLSTLSDPEQEMDAYLALLEDDDVRIHNLVIERLEELPPEYLAAMVDSIRPLATDGPSKVRQAALRLLARAGIG